MNLEKLNNLSMTHALEELTRCCGSAQWAHEMLAHRPYSSQEDVLGASDEIWWRLSETDWREAFTHHPKIGDIENLRKKFAATANLASSEQAGAASASEETLNALTEGNERYEEKFGYIFIVCATGKSAAEMLHILNLRLPNSPEQEIRIAAAEQAKITRLRLEKLLNPA